MHKIVDNWHCPQMNIVVFCIETTGEHYDKPGNTTISKLSKLTNGWLRKSTFKKCIMQALLIDSNDY